MGSNYVVWIILILLLVGMWYMSNRSRRQQQKAQEFRNNLKPGDEVMTHSGLLGTVVDVDGDTITLESAPGNHSRWIRAAIAKVVDPTPAVAALGDVDEDADESEDTEYDDEYDDIEVPDDLSSLDESDDDLEDDEAEDDEAEDDVDDEAEPDEDEAQDDEPEGDDEDGKDTK